MTRLEPVHPGEILKHDFIGPRGLSATAPANALGVSPERINEVVRSRRRGITASTALRLARYFGTDAQSWTNLQTSDELLVAERTAREALQAALPCERRESETRTDWTNIRGMPPIEGWSSTSADRASW